MINVLPPEVFNLIAAGEVVDRPYSVVKELVENAVDAGASEISVSIKEGGKSIEIVDNGCGISKDDLIKAYLPHATSKLSCAEDLEKIQTLGFRGEAVASIASVSRMKITSRRKGEDCYSLKCEGGKVGEVVRDAGCEGTRVSVNDLFYNTPARRKFLKSDASEEADITNVVVRLALLKPEISFTYYLNGRMRLKTYGDGLKSAVALLYGGEALDNCYFLDAEKNGIRIFGFLGCSNFYKPNRTYQSLFVNGRYVVNQTVSYAISNAYSRYLMKRQYPFYVLFLDLPVEAVDVNVHPNKADVRFADNQVVYGAVYSVISSVLDGRSKALEFIAELPLSAVEKEEEKSEKGQDETQKELKFEVPEKIGEDISTAFRQEYDGIFRLRSHPVASASALPEDKEEQETKKKEDVFEENKKLLKEIEEKKAKQDKIEPELLVYKGELFQTYLIYEVGDSAYFVDQHAAHEKMLYNKLLEKTEKRAPLSQPMLVPYILKANAQEFAFLEKNLSLFCELGFEIEEFGSGCFKVSAHPSDLVGIDLKKFFDDVLSSMETLKAIKLTEIFRDRLATMACKAAVKGGEKLTDEEVHSLIKEMDGDMGTKCPHGRPACVKMKKSEFEKLFKRIV